MSKIAALAKARAAQRSQTSSVEPERTSVSILDKLKENKSSPTSSSSSSQEQTDQRKRPSLGALAALRSKNKIQRQEPTPQTTPQPEVPIPSSSTETSTETPKRKLTRPAQQKRQAEEPLVKIEPIPSSHTLTSHPIDDFSTVFAPLSSSHPSKRRQIDRNGLYTVFTPSNNSFIAQIKENFNKPSPDDIALNAQKAAFENNTKKQAELEKKVADLKISTTPKHATKPKTPVDLDVEIAKRTAKPSTSFVVIGHVDAGKSTLTGRLLLECNTVSQATYNKLKRDADKAGMSSFSLAWVMDQSSEERERGVTIDICSSSFETDSASFTIVDAPGHRDFVPNMISGVAQADLAVLVVDSSTDAFESGFNLDGQTKEHTILARSLGVSRLVVAVNKMDNVDWEETRFDHIKGLMSEFLRITGWQESQTSFVPCSGLIGANVTKKCEDKNLTKWYNGPTLLQALEGHEQPDRDFHKPFVMQITEIETSKSEFTGRVDTGSIQPGETVVFSPSGVAGIVDSITLKDAKSPLALAGDIATLKVKNVELENLRVGDVMSIVTDEVPAVTKFEARLVMFDMDRPLLVGMPFVLFRGNVQQPAKISKIVTVYDRITGQADLKKKKVKHLGAKQSAYVIVECERKLPLQVFKENKLMGRVVLRKDGRTIGAGVVEKV